MSTGYVPRWKWLSVPPIPGAVVVNVGDCLMRWSNDILVSTPHRVVSDPAWANTLLSTSSPLDSAQGTASGDDVVVVQPARRSIAFFCNPNKGATVECLPTCSTADRPAKYAPVNALDYLVGRLTDTI